MNSPIAPRDRTRLAAAAVLVATFGLGGLAGAVLGRAGLDAPRDHPAGLCGGGLGQGGQPPLLQHLDLTPQQRPQLEAVVARWHPQMQALWQEFQPRITAVMDSARAEMDQILTAPQRARRDSLRATCGAGAPLHSLRQLPAGGEEAGRAPQ
jgi:Spy/CpxP family protein refolding chaperone